MTVTAQLRRAIRELARGCCEFCRISEANRFSKFQIDHIIPVKHGGDESFDNLCLACLECNSYKGPNVASLDPETGEAAKLYNPRQQLWAEHFKINPDATLTGLTPEGRVTIFVLRINQEDRVKQRLDEMLTGDYPCQKDELFS